MSTSSTVLGRTLVLAIATAAAMAGAVQAQTAEHTFAKDVAPILQAKCQSCHRPGEMAPMSLRTYQEVRPWARSIKNKVSRREMPPWFIDRTIGIQKYKNDASLSDDGNRRPSCGGSTTARARATRPNCRPRRRLRTARDGESGRRTSSSLRRNRSRCTRRFRLVGYVHRREQVDRRPLDQGGAAEAREREDRAPLLRRRRAARAAGAARSRRGRAAGSVRRGVIARG